MEKMDFKEKFWGGIFGVIAIVAAFAEMFVNGISAESITGAIKDVSGTLVVVVLFVAVIRKIMPKKIKNFNEAFDLEMEPIIKKYSPLIQKDEKFEGRYNLASKLSAIYNQDTGAYHTFFDFNKKSDIKFNVSKTVFMGQSKENFNDKEKIISDISRKIDKINEIVSSCSNTTDGFKVTFPRELFTVEDAKNVAEIIDVVMLLYIAEYKKT